MNTTTVDKIIEQAQDLSQADQLLLIERLVQSLRKEATPAIKERIPNLHPGAFIMAEDFDAPLPDEFWLGNDNV